MTKRVRLDPPPRSKRGRKKGDPRLKAARGLYASASKCTPELISKVYGYAKRGAPLETICDLLCISTKTAAIWRARGQLYEDNKGHPKEDICYAAFNQQFRKGKAAAMLEVTERLISAGRDHQDDPNLMRALTYNSIAILMRRDRKNWSSNEKQDRGEQESVGLEADMKYL